MLKVLNIGLNFAILPLKLDISQVLTDWSGKNTGLEKIVSHLFQYIQAEKTYLPPKIQCSKEPTELFGSSSVRNS